MTGDSLKDRHDVVRDEQSSRALRAIAEHGPITKNRLVEITRLSKPTVLRLVKEFAEGGLVHVVGVESGSVGRSPEVYALNPEAACVVGIDLGGTKIRAELADLAGNVLAEGLEATRHGDEALIDQIDELARGLAQQAGRGWQEVRVVAIGCPGIVAPDGSLSLADNLHVSPGFKLAASLEERLGTNVLIENDVNVAAIGESRVGQGIGLDNFVVISVGTGIGMGVIANGELVRGANGAAGEIAYLPIGAEPNSTRAKRVGALETLAGTRGIKSRLKRALDEAAVRSTLKRNATTEQIFAAARAGDPVGERVVREESDLLALTVLAVVSVLDPQAVILTGGVGGDTVLLAPLRRAVRRISPLPVQIEVSRLGARTGVVGATSIAVDRARLELFGTSER